MSDPQQNKDEAVEETFISHLVELRDRIIRAGVSVIVVFIGLVYWAPDIFKLLARPLMQNLPKDGKMIVTDVTGSFFVPMKVTMLVAFVIALPFVLYQIWAFVAPGLYQHEKKLVAPLVGSSYTLFLCGMAFAYFVVFPTIFRVMAHYNAPLGAEMTTDIDNYLSFVLTMFIAFGVTFEVPIVVVLLARMGVVSIKKLKEIRPYVIVGAFVISAVVTPPDVFSQLILAIPLIVLYEAGIIAARIDRRQGWREEAGRRGGCGVGFVRRHEQSKKGSFARSVPLAFCSCANRCASTLSLVALTLIALVVLGQLRRARLGRTLADRHVHVQFLVLAHQVDLHRRPRLDLRDDVQQARGVGDRVVVDADEDVARLDARLVGRSALQHARDDRARFLRQARTIPRSPASRPAARRRSSRASPCPS